MVRTEVRKPAIKLIAVVQMRDDGSWDSQYGDKISEMCLDSRNISYVELKRFAHGLICGAVVIEREESGRLCVWIEQ